MDTPNYQSEDQQELCRKWQFTDILLAGTPAMREASTGVKDPSSMLVQFPAEKDPDFKARVAMTTYDNGYADALDAAVGTLLRKPPKLGESVPDIIKQDAEDIDLAGTHIDVFVNRLTRKGLHRGAAYILVEKPILPAEMRGEPLRLNEAEALNLRPYWTLYAGPQVQNTPRYVVIDGRVVLQQIVFRECALVPEGEFGEEEITRYRVYRLPVEQLPNRQYKRTGPIEWQLWEESEEKDSDGKVLRTDIIQVDGGTLPAQFAEIPVSPCILNPDAENERQTCGPVFYDLGELSRKDFNQRSDYERSVHICSSPLLNAVNLKPEDDADSDGNGDRVVGPGIMYECTDGGSMSYVEPAGTGLATYESLLERNQNQMRLKGFEAMFADATVATTATEQLLRAGKRASRMVVMGAALHDCLETALFYHALWRGIPREMAGEVNGPDVSEQAILDAQQLATMLQEVIAGVQSVETYWQAKQRAGLLPDDFDAEAEKALLDEAKRKAMALASQVESAAFTRQRSPASG